MAGRIYFEAEIPSSDGRTSCEKHWDAALQEGASFDDTVIMIYNAVRKAFAPETPIRLWIDESMYAAIDLYAPENGTLHPGVRIASLRMRMDPWKKKKTSDKDINIIIT